VRADPSGRAGPTVTCGDGPVFPDGDAEQLDATLSGIDEIASASGAVAVRLRGLPAAGGRADDEAFVAVFAAHGYQPTRWATALVDLKQDEETLSAGLHRSTRKAIRRAESAGVEVLECSTRKEFLEAFVEPYGSWTDRDEAFVRQSLAMWDSDAERRYRFFVSVLEGRPIATLGTYRANGVATEIMSGRDPAAPPAVPGQDAVHWHAIRAHRQLGDDLFDLAGFNPTAGSAKEAGIRRFKQKWGAAEVAFVMYERVGQPTKLRRLGAALLGRARALHASRRPS